MATSDLHIPPSPATLSAAAAAELPLPLPPLAAPPDRSRRGWRGRILDAALAGVVLLFGFLVASFAARNSDLWQHLATGRLLARGDYTFGADPFAYTTQGVYWANHSWLFDWLLYGLFTTAGGTVLVVLKALGVVALAWVLLRIRQPGSSVLPAACTLLALLALSPRLLLQPAVLSYLFLGLTLWLLWRARSLPGPALKRFGPLLVLFALWVNLDSWFLLGPVLVALFWLGDTLQANFRLTIFDFRLKSSIVNRQSKIEAAPPPAARIPAWLLPAALAACLLNPHHVHAFTLPAELSPVLTGAGLSQDARFQRAFASPWELGLRLQPLAAISLAAWAYFGLVVLGLVSFLLNRKNLSGWRLPVWLSFGLLGAWQARLVPFFAVVAGPVTVLNLQEALRGDGRRRSVAAEWLACLAAGLALSALAWVGWLQGFAQEGRRAAWAVQPDPSLRRMAETLAEWRRQNKLGNEDRVFQIHPDVASYCAWFCPEEKGFLDHRLPLFAGAAREYETVCQELMPALDVTAGAADRSHPGGLSGGWQQVFRDRQITHLVVYDPDPRRLLATTSRLDQDPQQWTLLHVDGEALLYGWVEARRGGAKDPFAAQRFDAAQLAFSLREADGGRDLPPAPGTGPGRGPQRRPFWAHVGRPEPLPAWESAAATVFLRRFEDHAPQHTRALLKRGWPTFGAALAGLPALPRGVPAVLGGILFRLQNPLPFFGETGRPPALPLLAVRAARRALAANPDDANAYLRLGQAYLMLRNSTVERSREGRLPPLAMLRHVQIATALEHALVLAPDSEAAHQALVELYGERNFLDAALEHARARARLARRAGPQPGEDPERFDRRLDELDKRVEELERVVQDRQNQLTIRIKGHGNPLDEARAALKLGLAKQALDILLASKVELFKIAGAKLQLELLLLTGQAERVRALLDDEDLRANRLRLGVFELPPPSGRETGYRPPAYEWLLACRAAASGDYNEAEAALAAALVPMQILHRQRQQQLGPALSKALAAEVGAFSQPPHLIVQLIASDQRERLQGGIDQVDFLVADQADLSVVAGMLALESGRPRPAARHFEEALSLASTARAQCAGRPLALEYLRLLRQQ